MGSDGINLERRIYWLRKFFLISLIVGSLGLLGSLWIEFTDAEKPRPRAFILACTMNLRSIAEAKAQWALEQQKSANDVPSDGDLFGTGKYIREKPECPKGGIYTLGSVGEKPRCSIPGHTI